MTLSRTRVRHRLLQRRPLLDPAHVRHRRHRAQQRRQRPATKLTRLLGLLREGRPGHRERLHRVGKALQLEVPGRSELDPLAAAGEHLHPRGDENPVRWRLRAQARRLDRRHSEIVPISDGRLARTETDTNVQGLVGTSVAALEKLLHGHGTLHRGRRGCERHHQPVARVLDLPAARRGDRVPQQIEVLLAQLVRAYRAYRRREPSRSDQIGQQDRRKLNRLRHCSPLERFLWPERTTLHLVARPGRCVPPHRAKQASHERSSEAAGGRRATRPAAGSWRLTSRRPHQCALRRAKGSLGRDTNRSPLGGLSLRAHRLGSKPWSLPKRLRIVPKLRESPGCGRRPRFDSESQFPGVSAAVKARLLSGKSRFDSWRGHRYAGSARPSQPR